MSRFKVTTLVILFIISFAANNSTNAETQEVSTVEDFNAMINETFSAIDLKLVHHYVIARREITGSLWALFVEGRFCDPANQGKYAGKTLLLAADLKLGTAKILWDFTADQLLGIPDGLQISRATMD